MDTPSRKVRISVGWNTPSKNLTSTAGQSAKSNKNTPSKNLFTSAGQAAGASHDTARKKLFTSAGQAAEPSSNTMELQAMKDYAEFKEKVKRTVYLDNLSHQVTESVIRTALDQFGGVVKVDFLVNYTIPFDIPQSALVEMETDKQTESVVSMMDEFPFMMSGMPRPVRARHAKVEMFHGRPRIPGMNLDFCWASPSDPDYEGVTKLKLLAERHQVENLALIKSQLEEEQLLAKQQQENLNGNFKKHEMLESIMQTGKVYQLVRTYGINLDGVF